MRNSAIEVQSLLGFWADAGVETLYLETPIDRLAVEPPRRRPEKASAPVALPPSPGVAWPSLQEITTLAALGEAIAAFDGCELKRLGARRAVFHRGLANAPVMIIGEAPGAEEDRQGAPFVGRAGRLLDRMLAAAGIAERVFITNTVFWRPPGNRSPTHEEQAACAPFLERAIELVDPDLLLLMGGTATRALLDASEGVLSVRGRWFEWRGRFSGQALPAMPTLHPAFLLRQPGAKKHVWRDLLLFTERLDREARPGSS